MIHGLLENCKVLIGFSPREIFLLWYNTVGCGALLLSFLPPALGSQWLLSSEKWECGSTAIQGQVGDIATSNSKSSVVLCKVMGFANCMWGRQSQKRWDQQQMLSILVSCSSISMANPAGVFCGETVTSWERYKYWRWWLDFPYPYSPRISLRSWWQERSGRMKWGCAEGAWCTAPGAEQLWVDGPAHICMLMVLPRQKLGTFWQLLYEFPEQNWKYTVMSMTSASFC